MDEALRQFTADLATKLKEKVASSDVAEFVSKIKASGDDRTFEVVMSTSDEDRQGDELDQSKWDFKYFDMNPVVLFAHDYSSFPIGIITDIEIRGEQAVATGKFAPAGINPVADTACDLYQAKVLRAVSPGYIQNDDGTRELLEVSFCAVPAGRYALSMRQVSALGVSTRDLVTKGFFYETKGAVPYADHGTADPDTAWDGPAEVKACGDDLKKLKAICAWFDSENADKKSAYKLPHHSASGLKAVWKGVSAAGAAISGARGGVDIPEGDLSAVRSHLAKHYKQFGKTPPWEEKAQKTPQSGDSCQTDDGTPGVLAEDENNPGEMVCVPREQKGNKPNETNEDMKDRLTKAISDEHARHGEAVGKAIDEFTEKSFDKDGGTPNDSTKEIDEFTKAMDDEQEEHVAKCGKAIDENYELEDQKKSIDEFRKAMGEETLKHVKCVGKAIDEFKDAWADGDDSERKKAIDEFTKSASDELERHKDAHMEMCKAEMGEGETDEEKEKKALIEKSGRAISSATAAKIDAVIKAIEDHHESTVADHKKFTTDAIASLKELKGSPQDDEGKEKPSEKTVTPKQRPSTSGASELESYIFNQRLARQVKTAAEEVLRQVNPKIRELSARGR